MIQTMASLRPLLRLAAARGLRQATKGQNLTHQQLSRSVLKHFAPSATSIRFASSDAVPDEEVNEKKAPELLEFKAETKQLLDIVTNALYTDKEVFLRELISNASDACEKLRHIQASAQETTVDPDVPLEIHIETDEIAQTLTIRDTGVGMTRNEMKDNLGTIARSGSKAFMSELARSYKEGEVLDVQRGIIGKFGVGFYSSFMVGNKVEFRSKSAFEKNKDQLPKVWSSEGTGSYEISDLNDDIRQDRGSSIVIHLKDAQIEYCDESRIEKILMRYSNFVNFPISLNGRIVNTQKAVWAMDPKEVDEDTYTAFYRYIANAVDVPLDTIHFRADAPLDVKALFFIPSFHSEKYGMERMQPGVNLYSRKVLVEAKSPDILPDWLRFLKGAVDSEDLPISISRERAQDSALIKKLQKALTRKIISHLTTMAKKDLDKYKYQFYKEYAYFLKEGICQDHEFQEPLSKLLYFETSKGKKNQTVSFDEYISRCAPEQKEIYYLHVPSRDMAIESPYLEAFTKVGREVIFVYTPIDDFVMANLKSFQGRNIVTIEKSGIDLGNDIKKEDEGSNPHPEKLTTSEADEFCAWFKMTLGNDKVSSCNVTSRLVSSPAVVANNESGAIRKMMRMVDTTDGTGDSDLPKQQVEINPGHPIIIGINAIKEAEPILAKVVAEQIFDNCLMSAGLLDDGRQMIPRLNDILLTVIKDAKVHVEAVNPGKDSEVVTPIEAEIVSESMNRS